MISSAIVRVAWLLLVALLGLGQALRFELESFQEDNLQPKCIRNFVGGDTLVVVSVNIEPSKGDGQIVDVLISDVEGNNYGNPKDISGEKKMIFTVSKATALDVCVTNRFQGTMHHSRLYSRLVELDVEIGADALDYNAIQKSESLKPIETELRRVTSLTDEVVRTLDYLRGREQKLRDTNESTNDRVKLFAILSSCILLSLGVWQTLYMRKFFQRKGMI